MNTTAAAAAGGTMVSTGGTTQLDNEKMLEWLSRELEPICEADPDVLAKYVLALLKHEANNSDLQSHCVTELRDFLRDYTEDFVVSLFEAIESGSYKLPPGASGVDDTFVDEEEEDTSMWNRRRRTNSDEEGDRDPEDSFKRRRYDEPQPEGDLNTKPDDLQTQPPKNEYHQHSTQRYDRRDGRGYGRNGHHHDRRMDSRGYGRGMHQMMGMGYGSEPMYGRGHNVRGGGQMYHGHGHGPGYGPMDPWMGGMPNMYPPMMGMPMNPMMGSGGMYEAPQGWPQGPPSQMPRVNALLGNSEQSFPGADDFQPHAPFEESATLKCTGIPRYTKEVELYTHFTKFGKVVKLVLKRLGSDDPDKKVYNECLVQFDDPSDCRKCLSSPMSVLNNRHIRIYNCPHNIVSLSEVQEIDEVYPGAKADEQNGLWATASGSSGRGRGGRMPGRGRGRWTFGGRENADQRPFQRQDSSTSGEVPVSSETAGELSVSVPTSNDKLPEARVPRGERPVDSTTPTAAQLEKERLRGMVQQKYDELKNLRYKAENIWKQKEDLLQVQIDQYRNMRNKLQAAPGGEDKIKMMDTIEEKIMSLQSQLQEVRQQRETGVAATTSSTPAPSVPGRGRGRGREFRGRGRTSRGRGRGRFLGNKSLDLRSKAIILTNPPAGFVQSAHQHFSRHGHVLKITPVDNDQGVIVHFASRRDAENAFNRGTNYYGQIMKIDWYEESHATGDGGGTGNEEEGPHETDQEIGHHDDQPLSQEANEQEIQQEIQQEG